MKSVLSNDIFHVKPGVVFFRLPQWDRCGILDNTSMRYQYTNTTGHKILRLLSGKLTVAEVARTLYVHCKNDSADYKTILADVANFIEQLWHNSLVISGDPNNMYRKYLSPEVPLCGLIYWEFTNACNYNCIMCYNRSGKKRERELSLHETYDALSKMQDLGVRTIIFTGGEPLAAGNRLLKAVNRAGKLGIRCEIFTNASLIDETMAKRLRDLGIVYARVSVHGATAKTHETITRVPGSFHRTISGLRHLVASGIPTCWQVTTNKVNIQELRCMTERAIAEGCHGFRAGSLDFIGRGECLTDMVLSPKEEVTLWRYLDEATIAFGDQIRVSWGADTDMETAWDFYVTNPRVPKDDAMIDHNVYMRYAKNSLCGIGLRSMGLAADGHIIPCPALSDLNLGNIKKDSLLEVWEKSPYFKKLRENALENFPKCSSCGGRFSCCGGCRANAFHQTGDILGPDLRRCHGIAFLEQHGIGSVKSFFSEEELSTAKYHLHKWTNEFYGRQTEGLGPWIPYQFVIRKKLLEGRKKLRGRRSLAGYFSQEHHG